MPKKIIFITGGARSGKSDFALELAQRFAGRKAYLATARALDEEMAERIQKHKRNRPQDWQTLEEPLGVAKVLKEGAGHFSVILLDCLTLWISNSLMAKWGEKKILREADRLLEASQGMKGTVIIVSNEVGLGIVPDNPSARIFRDLSGLIHQKVARQADEVYFMVNGLPLQLKKRVAHSAKSIAQRTRKKVRLITKSNKMFPFWS